MNKELKGIVAPSILSADFSKIDSELIQLIENGVKYIHLDVMDGSFVPPITFGAKLVKDIRYHRELILDTHLMVVNPEKHISTFANAGSDIITVHSEASLHLHSTLMAIKKEGKQAGVSIVPSTPVSSIKLILGLVEVVLVMSVNPGYGGQKFIPFSLDKIRELDRIRKEENLSFKITVDGGVNEENGFAILEAGADILVMGSAYFSAKDRKGLIKKFQKDLF
ncbi:MAG: ribulose-phosphate 3-epimerase [Sphaerochaetaceae bacterium]